MADREGIPDRRAPEPRNNGKTKAAAAAGAGGAMLAFIVMQFLLPDVRDLGREVSELKVAVQEMKRGDDRHIAEHKELEARVLANYELLAEGGRHTEEEATAMWMRHEEHHAQEQAQAAAQFGEIRGMLKVAIDLLANGKGERNGGNE